MTSWTSVPDGSDDRPFDITVIVPTILRDTLLATVRSIFVQDFPGRVQILIGVDRAEGEGDRSSLERIGRECPPNMAVTVCDLGYSLARSYGDMNVSRQGGTMRAGLSVLAAARYVTYLDDDNWWAPDHLSSLRAAIEGHGYAWSQRWMVRGSDDIPVTIDEWISVGPGIGLFARISGGLVDTSCMMLDRSRCADVLWRWAHAAQDNGAGDDRLLFRALVRKETGAGTGRPTVYYRYDPAREHAVQAMTALAIQKPHKPAAISLAELRSELIPPPPPAAPDEFRRPARRAPPPPAPTEETQWIYRLVQRRRPDSIVDLFAGDGTRTIRFVEAVRAANATASILAIDEWLSLPGDDRERGPFAMHRPGVAHDNFRKAIENAVANDIVWSLPACPFDMAATLGQLGLTVSMICLPFNRQNSTGLMRKWWPLLREDGVFFGPAVNGLTRSAKEQIDLFVGGRAGAMRLVGKGANTHLIVAKRAFAGGATMAEQ